ncbi:hypothetical protein GBA52_002044 [Prunus armeniaca]|nr:hypothetical protein GBA52_002044 [Prunus armeniaca]
MNLSCAAPPRHLLEGEALLACYLSDFGGWTVRRPALLCSNPNASPPNSLHEKNFPSTGMPGQKTHFISQSNKIVPPAQSSQSHLFLLVQSKAQFFLSLFSCACIIRPSTVRSTETVQEKVQVFRSLPLEFNKFKQKNPEKPVVPHCYFHGCHQEGHANRQVDND